MGLSKTKTKTTNAPSAYARPFIDAGGAALGSAYNAAQPIVSQVQQTTAAQLPGLAERAFGANPGLDAASGYNTAVLNGDYLDGNPQLDRIVADTNANVRRTVQDQFSSAGRTGSGANVSALARALSSSEAGLRGAEYSAERARMGAAAGLAPSLELARYAGPNAYIDTASRIAGLGTSQAQAYAGGLGSLYGGYNTRTDVSNPSLGAILAQAAAQAAAAYGGGR